MLDIFYSWKYYNVKKCYALRFKLRLSLCTFCQDKYRKIKDDVSLSSLVYDDATHCGAWFLYFLFNHEKDLLVLIWLCFWYDFAEKRCHKFFIFQNHVLREENEWMFLRLQPSTKLGLPTKVYIICNFFIDSY